MRKNGLDRAEDSCCGLGFSEVLEAHDKSEEYIGDLHTSATELGKEFTFPLPNLIAATRPEDVQRWPIRDRKPLKQWSKGRATLIGDAAHPTSPYAAYSDAGFKPNIAARVSGWQVLPFLVQSADPVSLVPKFLAVGWPRACRFRGRIRTRPRSTDRGSDVLAPPADHRSREQRG